MTDIGDRVAWSIRSYAGRMDGISKVHRVMLDGVAYCGEPIPDPRLHFPLIKSLRTCVRCERLHAHSQTQTLEQSA